MVLKVRHRYPFETKKLLTLPPVLNGYAFSVLTASWLVRRLGQRQWAAMRTLSVEATRDLIFPNSRGGYANHHNMLNRNFYPLFKAMDRIAGELF